MENEELTHGRNVDASGYSEAKLDRDVDLQAGQWIDLGKKKQPATSQQTTVIRNQRPASSGVLQKLVDYSLDLIRELEAKVRQIGGNSVDLKDVERIQSKLQVALRAIQFEQKGTLDISKLPKEVQDLLK